MTSLRVLHVVPHLDRVGGYERQALALARVQNRRPDTTAILLTHAAPGLPAMETTEAGRIHRLRRGILRHHPGRWWRDHGRDIDVVHAHALHKLSGQLVARAHAAGVPALVKVATAGDVDLFATPELRRLPLDGDDRAPGGPRWRLMLRTTFLRLRLADVFLALNGDIEAELARHGLPARRVDNGVDVGRFRPPRADERRAARARLGLPEDAFVVVSVGRLSARKEHGWLLDAFARGLGREPRARLLIVGDGPLRGELERRVHDLGLGDRATLTGDRDDVRGPLWAADVCAHVARQEGQPNAVLEALACGLPMVPSDIGPHRDLLRDPAVLPGPASREVAPGDTAALARALAEAAHADLEPARLAARQLATSTYDLDRVAADVRRLYVRLRAGRTRRWPGERSARG